MQVDVDNQVYTPQMLIVYNYYVIQESRCAYVVILMAVYWMTEALPLGVTALLPIVALPVLGITGAKQAASNYIKVNRHTSQLKIVNDKFSD